MRYLLARKRTVRAKLLELTARRPCYFRDGWSGASDEGCFYTHDAHFITEDSKQYTMPITQMQYQEMLQGTTGLLMHKERWFLCFERDK